MIPIERNDIDMDNIELKGVLLEKEPDPRNYKISQLSLYPLVFLFKHIFSIIIHGIIQCQTNRLFTFILLFVYKVMTFSKKKCMMEGMAFYALNPTEEKKCRLQTYLNCLEAWASSYSV